MVLVEGTFPPHRGPIEERRREEVWLKYILALPAPPSCSISGRKPLSPGRRWSSTWTWRRIWARISQTGCSHNRRLRWHSMDQKGKSGRHFHSGSPNPYWIIWGKERKEQQQRGPHHPLPTKLILTLRLCKSLLAVAALLSPACLRISSRDLASTFTLLTLLGLSSSCSLERNSNRTLLISTLLSPVWRLSNMRLVRESSSCWPFC